MKKGLRYVAAVAILLNGLEHLNVAFIDEPHEYLDEFKFIGFMFMVGVFVSFVVAYQLFRRSSGWAWLVGAAVTVGQVAGLIMSRTTGLFGFYDEGYSQEAKITLFLAAVYLVAYIVQIARTPEVLRELRLGAGKRESAPVES